MNGRCQPASQAYRMRQCHSLGGNPPHAVESGYWIMYAKRHVSIILCFHVDRYEIYPDINTI
jgi:hypothetical protein